MTVSRPGDHSPESSRNPIDIIKLSVIRHALESAAIKGFLENSDYLKQQNLYPRNADNQFLDVSELVSWFGRLFNDLRLLEKSGLSQEKIYQSPPYRKIVYLLSLGNVVVPNIAGDWEVDRYAKAEHSLGIKNFGQLEQTLREKYSLAADPDPLYRHLEKGIGNGEALRQRQIHNSSLPANERFEQWGIADKIYYPIERVLKDFLKTEYRENLIHNRVIELLGIAIRKELKLLWFEAEGSVIRKWTPRQKTFDLNVIYDLLKNPRPWLERWYSPRTGKYKVSQEFEHDREERLDFHTHQLFLELSGYSEEEREKILMEMRVAEVKERRTKINAGSLELNGFIKALKTASPEDLEANIDKWLEVAGSLLEPHSGIDHVPRSVEGLFAFLDESAQLYLAELSILNLRQKELSRLRRKISSSENPPVLNYPQRIFSPEFAGGIEDASSPRPNLNEHASVFINNLVVDQFDKIPKHFPPESIFMITGVRSDSHESDADFQKDIQANLALLKPGGCLLTDGIRASYSRVFRFQEILEVLENEKGFHAEVVVDKTTNEPLSLLIQKKHPEGYLTDEEKNRIFDSNANFVPLAEIAHRPDLVVLNSVRRNIMRAYSNNVDSFRRIHKRIHTQVVRLLVSQANSDLVEAHQGKTQWYEEKFNLIQTGKLHVTEKAVETVTERINSEVKALIRESRIVLEENQLEHPEPNTLYTFPAKGLEKRDRPINRLYRYAAHELPTNEELSGIRLKRKLEQRQWELWNELRRIKKMGISSPITIISFADCVTNNILAAKLDELSQDIVRHISIRFTPSPGGGFSSIEQKEALLTTVDKIIEQGGLIVGGGSWHDSYTETFYRDFVAKKLLSGVNRPDSRVRMFNICFSAQMFADVMGKKYYDNPKMTHPGALEIGPTPVNVLRAGRKHPWFSRMPASVTFATTHSGHVVLDTAIKEGRSLPKEAQFTILAESDITGLPLAWSSCNDRVLSTIIHPEIDLISKPGETSDVSKIQEQLVQRAEGIKKRFNIDPSLIQHNWNQIRNASGKPRIAANGGRLLLVSGLLHLAKSIV